MYYILIDRLIGYCLESQSRTYLLMLAHQRFGEGLQYLGLFSALTVFYPEGIFYHVSYSKIMLKLCGWQKYATMISLTSILNWTRWKIHNRSYFVYSKHNDRWHSSAPYMQDKLCQCTTFNLFMSTSICNITMVTLSSCVLK